MLMYSRSRIIIPNARIFRRREPCGCDGVICENKILRMRSVKLKKTTPSIKTFPGHPGFLAAERTLKTSSGSQW
jgi:hypothetical protein